MNGKALAVISVSVAAGALLAPEAGAAGFHFSFSFGDRSPGRATTALVAVVFPTDDQGRPKQLAGLDFRFPEGTAIDRSVAPVSVASDDQINILGADACPAETQVGWGAAKAHTGF